MAINGQIKFKQMLVIGPSGEQLGIKSKDEALTLASYAGFDLVLINDNPENPVCKLMDYNKFKYEKKKKQKESQKKQKENNAETKEYRLSPNIDVHDFNTKLKHAERFLKAGNKVKVSIRLRGREMGHSEMGVQTMKRFAEACEEFANVEKQPKLEGRQILMFLAAKPAK